MKRINKRGFLVAAFLLEFMGVAFAQTTSGGNAGATPDLSLVGTLEGRRTWISSYDRREKSAGVKLEQVKIENGKGTALFTGYAAVGQRGSCSTVSNVPAELTLDSSGMLTIIAKTEDCGTWEYTLQRVSPTLFKGHHRVNPTEIVLDFKPG